MDLIQKRMEEFPMAEAFIEKDVEIGDVNDGMVRFKEDGAKLKESSKGRLLTHDRLAPP